MLLFYPKYFHFRKLHSINNVFIIKTEKIREEKKKNPNFKVYGQKTSEILWYMPI